MANAFNMEQCDVCNKQTWHYKPAGAPRSHCTQHSDWKPGLRHANPEKEIAMLTKMVDVPEAPKEWELRKANRMDQSLQRISDSRTSFRTRTASMAGTDWEAIFAYYEEDQKLRDPNKIYCTFCGNEVDYVRVTSENKPRIHKRLHVRKDETGNDIIIETDIEVKAERIDACPDCCLRVRKPIHVQRV